MSKIFVRHRRHVGQGAGRPRFAVVASTGIDLKVYIPRLRRVELEKIAAETGAEIVYLPAGAGHEHEQGEGGSGRRRRRQVQQDD